MKDHKDFFAVDQMASILGVSKSGYYDYRNRPSSLRERYNKGLLSAIQKVFQESHETYGSPRIHAELREQGYSCSRPRVARLMRKNGIQAKMYRKFHKTTKQSEKPYYKGQDFLQQKFSAPKPDAIWVADISYISVNYTWAYLAIILDLYSRKVVGMALKEHMRTDLILEALNQALLLRKPPKGLIHHSDLGGQYTSHDLYKAAKKHGITLSHGKTGNAYDNAAMESFFHTLKTELVYFKHYKTLEEANLDIFTYIHTFYNQKRRHSTLNYQTPNQWENMYYQNQNISVSSV